MYVDAVHIVFRTVVIVEVFVEVVLVLAVVVEVVVEVVVVVEDLHLNQSSSRRLALGTAEPIEDQAKTPFQLFRTTI